MNWRDFKILRMACRYRMVSLSICVFYNDGPRYRQECCIDNCPLLKKEDAMEHLEILKRFGYHAPSDEETVKAYEQIRGIARDFCYDICERCPECRERSLAITKLEEVVMWANAAIARNGLKRD